MPPTITAAYSVAGSIVAAIDAPDVPWIARKANSVVSIIGDRAIEEALRTPFRVSDDAQRIEWPGAAHVIGVADLLDPQKAQVFFVSWRAAGARPAITKDELIGCWQTAAGYTLLEPNGHVRIKVVSKGGGSDLTGDWRWRFSNLQEFQVVRQDADDLHTYRVAMYDGRTMILSVASRTTIGGTDHTVELPTVWKRSKPPRSWT